MNEHKFIPELYLKQPRLTYSAWGPFAKYQERILKFKEIGNLKHLVRNELNKFCFAHDAAYSDSEDLAKRTFSDKILIDRAFEISRNNEHDRYQKALEGRVCNFFVDETGSGVSVNAQLVEELHNPVN